MDRRARERYRVWFPMTVVNGEAGEGTAISYDASSGGILMACPGSLEVGAAVMLSFKISGDEPEEREVPGTVVRVEKNQHHDGPWRFRLAVEFDAPQPDLEAILETYDEG